MDDAKIALFEEQELKTWFQREARDLPWRQNPSPYAVWISEIMLQQTQVAVVKEYFTRWMQRFPSIESLAKASTEEVIKMWEGLGYYSRARHVHAAAIHFVEKHQGNLPSSREELEKVKGLGPYTIGAILSFAFRQKAAAVDGNVIRVLTRYFAISDDIQKTATKKNICSLAENILPDEEPWLVVEGLIELGASVCKRDPQCWACPLRSGCEGFNRGIQAELPKKGRKTNVTPLTRHVFVIACQEGFLLKKAEKGKVMADLYEFPYSSSASFPFAIKAKMVKRLPKVQHCFTRYKVTLHPTLWSLAERLEVPGYTWVEGKHMQKHPFSAGHRKIVMNLGL